MADPRSVHLNEGLIFRIRFKRDSEQSITLSWIDEHNDVARVDQAVAYATIVCIDLPGNALRLTPAE